ncbi:tripartite motif-containing protein 16-like [Triplophysa dalaica]|uniref:tripartite motif-containing protein 16-like n=1 Tax=Triplophysa dalaica TaxID=1582913 RepID=UPI0024DFDD95|nr:tripartite motif-containing protein 16-like [Triplophysa dalaica]
MAEARVSFDVDQFKCPICLELLTDPVSINCGHSFCNSCIQLKWNEDANTGVYSCPLCRLKFSSRPVLGRNIMLADMVERMRKMSERQLAGPDDEECSVCAGEKFKAIKTCLVCLAAYCEVHLNLHDELNPGDKHRVVNVTGKLQDKICSIHKKLKDVYCFEDQKSVCVECVPGHRGHRFITNNAARYQQYHLHQSAIMGLERRIKETENALKTLHKAKEEFKRSTQALEKDCEKTFEDLISLIRRQQCVVRDMIKVREQKELQRSDRIQTHLQMTLVEIKNRADELRQLSRTEDDIYFLQRMSLLQAALQFQPPPKITVNMSIFDNLKRSVSNIKTQIEQIFKNETAQTEIQLIMKSTPTTREDFLRYFQPLTLDSKTVHKNLILSENNTRLTWIDGEILDGKKYIPERFTYLAQALCVQGLSSCSYWEVEWGGPQVYIAVAYKGIQRNGCSSCLGLGHNEKSWSLCCSPSRRYVCHDFKETEVLEQISTRIGIFLHHKAGSLSFYNVSNNTMSLIHQIKAKFTEPLYPAFWVFDGSYVRLGQFWENVAHPHTIKEIKEQNKKECSVLSQFYLWHY